MKKTILSIFFLLGIQGWVTAQQSKVLNTQERNTDAIKFAQSITQEDLSKHLHVIAADSMEGRLTGKPGQKKAARYISDYFKNIGLTPPVKTPQGNSYYQAFNFTTLTWGEVYIRIGNEKKTFKKDVYALKNSNMNQEVLMDVVFGGSGSESDLSSLSIKDKGVVCIPQGMEDDEIASLARSKGARAVFIVAGKNQKEFEESVEFNNYYLKRGTSNLQEKNRKEDVIFYVSPTTAAQMLKTQEADLLANASSPGKFNGSQIGVKAEMIEKIQFSSENVLGFLEGTDKKDEIVIVTAHYDHIGAKGDQINNGADDDGSGTVSVMEIAEAFTKAKAAGKTPRRSILFMTVAGEELGLYGSKYYTDYDPVFPLKNTVVDLNIDMVGRIGGDYLEANDPNYIYLIGSDKLSSELHQLSEETNEKYTELKLDYTYNDENDPNRFYYRSDHYNFAKNNIPIIFYFNGVHPDYHQPTDEVDKIHFPKMEKIARLIFHTAWEIANREERLKVDKK